MKILRSPKFLIFLIVFINFLGYGIVFPILPLLTEKYGGDPLTSGVLIAVFSLMQVAAMPIMGRLSDKYGRRPLLIFSLWGTVLSFAIMGITHSILWLMIARIIDGVSEGNMGILQSFGSVGRIFGTISAGYIYEKINPFSPSLMGAVVMFVILLLGLGLNRKTSSA